MDIRRLLPKDYYDANLNAASPSASNPFATIADLPTPTGDGIYSGNGIIPTATAATLTTTLSIGTNLFKLTENLNRVELAMNGGSTTMGTANNYLQQNVQMTTQFSNSALYTGFHANRNGGGIAMRARSTAQYIDSVDDMIFGTAWNNDANSGGSTEAMRIGGTNQNVSIGTSTTTGQRFLARADGNTSASTVARFQNLTGSNILSVKADGLVQINTNATASVYNLVSERSTSDNTIHQHARFLHRFTPTADGSGRTTTLNTTAYKQGNFNSFYNVGVYASARALSGSGNITNQYAGEFANIQNSTGTISRNFSINALMTATSGTVTHHGGVQIQTNALNGTAVVTNMYGIWLNAPSNTGGVVGTTYGIKLDPNDLGTTNWGIYQASTAANNYFGGITLIGSSSVSGTAKLQVTGDIEILGVNNGLIMEDSLGSGNRCIVYVKELTPGVFTLHTNPLP